MRKNLYYFAFVFFLSRISILIYLFFVSIITEKSFFKLYCVNDCLHYMTLSQYWYSYFFEIIKNNIPDQSGYLSEPANGFALFAFMPFFPGLLRFLNLYTNINIEYLFIFVPMILFFIGIFVFHEYVKIFLSEKQARDAVWFYAFWPIGIYFSIGMTEAIFMPLMVATFLCARKNYWLLVALLVLILSATRNLGFLISIPLFLLACREFGFKNLVTFKPGTEKAILALFSSGLGFAIYMAYIYSLTGDTLAFSHVQSEWSRSFNFPWVAFFELFSDHIHSENHFRYNILIVTIWLFVIFYLLKYIRSEIKFEIIFILIIIIIPIFSGQLISLPRFASASFPLIIFFVPWAQKKNYMIFAKITSCILFFIWSIANFRSLGFAY